MSTFTDSCAEPKLQAQRANTAVRNQNDVKKEVEDFSKREKEAEAAKIKVKADEKNFKQARSAVAAYHPIDRRTQKTAYGKQGTVQKYLSEYIDKEAARPNVDTADILAKVVKHIDDLYKADERLAERV